MNQTLDTLLKKPHNAYLRPEELNQLSQFVSSLPERVNFYRRLRSEELVLMQTVAEKLQQQFPQEAEARLTRSLQTGILILRYAAMAMLRDDPEFITRRLGSWLPEITQGYGTQTLDRAVHTLVKQNLAGRFSSQQMSLLSPGLDAVPDLLELSQEKVSKTVPESAEEDATLASLF